MIKAQRLETLKQLIKERNTLSIDELVTILQTTVPTLHRDLDQLEAEGYAKKVHGGVTYNNSLAEEPRLEAKLNYYTQAKDSIAQRAAKLIQPGEVIFLDAGTTAMHMIPYLAGRDVKVFTNGVNHIEALIQYKIEFYLVGGYVKHTTRAVVGDEASAFIEKYYFDRAFIGANGISKSYGYTTPELREGHLKRLVINHARKAYIIADHSKFDHNYLVKIIGLDAIELITDEVPDDYQGNVKEVVIVE